MKHGAGAAAARPAAKWAIAAAALAAQGLLAVCGWRHVAADGAAGAQPGATALFALAIAAGAWSLAQALRRAADLDVRWLLAVGALLAIAAALVPPFLSNDLWDYLARGRVEVLGGNPYTTTVASLREEPRMVAFARDARWPEWCMPYGPLAALLQWLCALPDSPWTGLWLWKAAAAAAHVATAVIVHGTIAPIAGPTAARRGLVLWLWHPWLLLEGCGQAHNDVFVALQVALLGRALVSLRFGCATSAYGGALLVKHGLPTLAPLLLALAIHRRRVRAAVLGTLPVLAVAALAYWRWWSVPDGLAWFTRQGGLARGSLISLSAWYLFHRAGTIVRVVGAIAALGVLARGVVQARDEVAFARIGALSLAVFLAGSLPNFAPWYHLWWMPLFALARAPVLDATIRALAVAGPAAYLVFVATREHGQANELWQFGCAFAWPFSRLFAGWRGLLATSPPPRRSEAAR